MTHMITVACRAAEAETALRIRQHNLTVWVAAGIHPHEATHATDDELTHLTQLWREPGIIAAGEMGLDYHYTFSPPAVQQNVFRKQLEMAAATQLPIVIHCREAQLDVIRILSECGYVGRPVVFHCFSGTPAEAAEIRSKGWRVSFTGLITFKNAGPQQQVVRDTPEDQIMFETDSPYLSPEPVAKCAPTNPRTSWCIPHASPPVSATNRSNNWPKSVQPMRSNSSSCNRILDGEDVMYSNVNIRDWERSAEGWIRWVNAGDCSRELLSSGHA